MKIVATLPNLLRRLAPPLLILSVALGASAVFYAVGAWVLETLGTPQEITKAGDIAFIGMPFDGYFIGATGKSAGTVEIPPFAVPDHDGSGTTIVGNVSLDLHPGGSASDKTFGSASAPSPDGWADNLLVAANERKYVFEGWINNTGRKLDGAAETTSARRAASFASPFLRFTDDANSRNVNAGLFSVETLPTGSAGSGESDTVGNIPGQSNALEVGPLLAVPEPGSATLALLGGLGLLSLRHRKSAAV
jgi:hypothetical protein